MSETGTFESGPFFIRIGLIGEGIGLSRTPGMHLAEARALGLSYRYELIDTAQMPGARIEDLLTQVEAQGYTGVNVTHPFKQAVIGHLDDLSEPARAVDAVNTVLFRDGRRMGHNTDYFGFATAFRQQMAGADTSRVLLLGAGGAGGAVANALLDEGVDRLAVYDVNSASATRLAARLRERFGATRIEVARDLEAGIASASGLVNATPIGMASHSGSPVPLQLLTSGHWVADIIYFPLETELLRHARSLGCRTMNGAGMAVYQAVRAFELFSGHRPDPDRMRASFDRLAP